MTMMKKLLSLTIYAIVVATAEAVQFAKKIQQWKKYRAAAERARSSLVRRYCDYSRTIFPNVGGNDNAFVDMDCFPIPVWIAANSILANCLAERYQAKICSYDDMERDPYTDALYNSFNCRDHFVVSLSNSERKRRKTLFCDAIASLKTNHDLFNLEVDG